MQGAVFGADNFGVQSFQEVNHVLVRQPVPREGINDSNRTRRLQQASGDAFVQRAWDPWCGTMNKSAASGEQV